MVIWISLYKGITLAVKRTEGNCGRCLAMLRDCSKETKHMVLQSKPETAESALNIH